LGGSRDAGIAVNHAAILEQNCGTEKRNPLRVLGFFQKIFDFVHQQSAGAGQHNVIHQRMMLAWSGIALLPDLGDI
jgi:hypothetical protein